MVNVQTNIIFQQLNESNKRISVFQGGTRCFTGDTLVLTTKGYKQIKDIIINKDIVYSFDENTKKIVTNKVTNKFIYESEPIHIELKDGTIIKCTKQHKFYLSGRWITAGDLERCYRNFKISSFKFREDKNYKLQKLRKNKINETCFLSRLFKNGNRWKNKIFTSFSCSNFYSKSRKQTTSKSYRQRQEQQQYNKFRMGNTSRKYYPYDEPKSTNNKQWKQKWNEQINRKTSKRNKRKIQTKNLYGKNLSKGIWSEFINNKRYIISEENLEASELTLNKIKHIKYSNITQKVYDIEVENTHTYLVTKNNIISHNSGKTYNIATWYIIKLVQEENKILTVARQTLPSLKNTVFRDYYEILLKLDLWDSNNFNKSEMTYKLGSNIIEFRNLDDDQKVRGAKRNYLHLNEANEIPLPIWKQLLFRTTEKIVLDYNPSDEFHWIYDEVLIREDTDFYKSTYLDNPFLPKELVLEIERLKEIDPNYWRIYGLGERGISETTIYTNWETTDEEKPTGYNCYGLDFGFNDPNALIDMVIVDCETPYIWLDEKVYESKLTTPELIERMRNMGISQTDTIYGDSSRPETIQEIYNSGFNIHPCPKGKGSVKAGIDWIKRYKIKITKRSLNLIKEIRSYKWKVDKNERVLDEPVDLNNHALDAVRYSLSEKVEALIPQKIEVFSDFEL